MTEIEIGKGKRGRTAYSFDDIAIVPSRRTRDPEEVSVAWQIDAYRFEIPVLAAPMDSVVSPATAIAIGRLGGLGVLNLEGLWTRYEDPEPLLAEIAGLDDAEVTRRMQEIYEAPIQPELVAARIAEVRAAGVTVAAALSPQRTAQLWKTVVDAGADLFVIRGTTVSAEHVSGRAEPLNLKQFIYELDVPVIVGGCATYQAALHLMRTGAAGVLVGFGGGASHTTRSVLGVSVPMASAVADVHAARRDYLDESGGRYVHVIADGGVGRLRRHLQGDRLRGRRGDGRLAAGPGHRGAGSRLPLGLRGPPRRAAARRAGPGRHHRLAGGDPLRPVAGVRRVDEHHRRAAPGDGDHRLLRPQGVPAGRGHRRPLTASQIHWTLPHQTTPVRTGVSASRRISAVVRPRTLPPGNLWRSWACSPSTQS